MTAIAIAKDDRMTVSGTADLTVLAESSLHKLLVGKDAYKCAFCPDSHALAMVAEIDGDGEEQGLVIIRHAEEAWLLARFLLVEAFGVVDGTTWDGVRAMAEIGTGEVMA